MHTDHNGRATFILKVRPKSDLDITIQNLKLLKTINSRKALTYHISIFSYSTKTFRYIIFNRKFQEI